MRQRSAGVSLLLVAALAVIVVPGLLGHKVSGQATPEALADPPQPGACVVATIDQNSRPGFTLADGTQMTMPVAVFGPCQWPIYGEVTSVQTGPDGRQMTLGEHLHAVDSCLDNDVSYLGGLSVPAGPAVGWQPLFGIGVTAVGPQPWQRNQGQTWVACVVGPAVGGTYAMSARGALTAAGLPWAVEACSSDLAPAAAPISCDQPHRTQLIGTSTVNQSGPISDDMVQTSCRSFAGAMLARSDPTADGELVVTVVPDAIMTAFVNCVVSAADDRRLVGSVISLGASNPPFAR